MIDLNVENGSIVFQNGIFEGNLAIDDGKIVGISKSAQLESARKINASHLLIFPGFIDAHVHFRVPANENEESFLSGTSAAASGGITTVFDMPGPQRATVLDAGILAEKKRVASESAIVDYSLFGAAGSGNLDRVPELARAGVIGFKTFMTSGSGFTSETDAQLLRYFEAVAKTNLVAAVHSEVGSLVDMMTERLALAGEKSAEAHSLSRPNLFEALAIHRVIEIANFSRGRGHIVHMSTKEGCELVSAAKARRLRITAETCPHYLLLTRETLSKLGPYAKVNPPLRTTDDQEALWRGLQSGTIDLITSDHAPLTTEQKEDGWEDIWNARSGSPGVENGPMLILTKCKEGLLSYSQAARLMSESPAKIFGLFPKKGAICVGSDADLTIVDPKKTSKFSRNQLLTKSKFATLYDGWEVTLSPRYTIVRGEVVSENWNVIGRPGFGRFVSPH